MSNTVEPFFRPETRRWRVRDRCPETDTRSREKLRIRNNNSNGTLGIKLSSVIGKTTGDYDLKKKIRKSDISVEAITEAQREYMYEKLGDSPVTEDEMIFTIDVHHIAGKH